MFCLLALLLLCFIIYLMVLHLLLQSEDVKFSFSFHREVFCAMNKEAADFFVQCENELEEEQKM